MLLDQIMPTYQFNTVHSTVIHAPSKKIFAAVKDTKVSDIRFFYTLFQVRSFPGYITSRGKRYFVNNDTTILEQAFTRLGFSMLAEDPDHEMVLAQSVNGGGFGEPNCMRGRTPITLSGLIRRGMRPWRGISGWTWTTGVVTQGCGTKPVFTLPIGPRVGSLPSTGCSSTLALHCSGIGG